MWQSVAVDCGTWFTFHGFNLHLTNSMSHEPFASTNSMSESCGSHELNECGRLRNTSSMIRVFTFHELNDLTYLFLTNSMIWVIYFNESEVTCISRIQRMSDLHCTNSMNVPGEHFSEKTTGNTWFISHELNESRVICILRTSHLHFTNLMSVPGERLSEKTTGNTRITSHELNESLASREFNEWVIYIWGTQ